MTRRRGSSSAAPPSPVEDEDLLQEILIHLPPPPQPSSLPRASAVCRQWRRLATDPEFLRRFRAHHRKPPLLGLFYSSSRGLAFTPILDPPDRIPTQRLDLQCYHGDYHLLGCRHGRVLAMDMRQRELLVFDPITGEQHRVTVPRDLRTAFASGTVLCPAADDQGHVQDGCPFKVVLMTMYADDYRPVASVYSSESRTWGDLVKTAAPCDLDDAGFPRALVGNALYWLQIRVGKDILMFDLDEQSLTLIKGPPITSGSGRIIQAEDGAVCLAELSSTCFQMWHRNVNRHGVATWMLWKTIELHTILGLPRTVRIGSILGYSDDTEEFFILGRKARLAARLPAYGDQASMNS